MACRVCGFSDMRALSVDHIEGNGAAHRKVVKGTELYRWLRENNYPDGFQILCMNCQFIKRHENNEFATGDTNQGGSAFDGAGMHPYNDRVTF